MDVTKKNEELKFIINRYDGYLQSVNAKGNLFLTTNTFILGGIIAGFISLNAKFHFSLAIQLLFILTLVTNLFSTAITLFAIKPYLNDKKENEDGSLIYFGDVADYHTKQHNSMWQNLSDDMWHIDLKKQSVLLSLGLKQKFRLLNYATWCVAVQIIFVVLFGVYMLSLK